MLENLQRTSTPHSGLQPNSQVGNKAYQLLQLLVHVVPLSIMS